MVDNRYRPAFDNRVRPAYNRYRPAFDNRVRPAITKQYSDGGRTKTLLSEDPIPESVYREVDMAIDAASRAQPVNTTLEVPVTRGTLLPPNPNTTMPSPQSPAEAGIQKGSLAGLLGGAIGRMMDRSLYSTPTFGGNFITEQASGEVALRGMESAAAEKQQKAALEAAKIQADLAKANKVSLDSTQTDLVLNVAEGQKVLNTIQEAKKYIARTKLTGAGPQALQVAKNILTAIGIDPGYSDMQAYKDKVGEIQASIAKSKIFGRDLNKFDQQILAKLITEPGLFKPDSALLAQLNNFIKRTEADIGAKRRLLQAQGLGNVTRNVLEKPQSIFRD